MVILLKLVGFMISYVNKLGTVSVGGSNPVRIMGILNTSPESFYKKSISSSKQKIIDTINRMQEEGADFIDVGGMSTAPYLSTMITEKMEMNRIIKGIKIIQQHSNLPISVDTCRSSVAKEALELGVDIINDITGLKYDPLMPKIVEKYSPSLILCAYSKKTIIGKGSAIFIHLTKNYKPTAGCIALKKKDLLILLKLIDKKTKIKIT